MESELLKEPWIFPQSKANATKEEEKTAFSAWEENFQDLSGWCMDTFQGQCDFHIGESSTFKLSGTKYEGNSVLSSEEGVLRELTSITGEEQQSTKMSTAGVTERLSDNNSRYLQSTLKPTNKYEKEDGTMESSDASNLWLKLGSGTAATTATTATDATSWNKQNDTNIDSPLQPKYRAGHFELDDACPPCFDSAESQRETWDVLRTIETTGSDSFDLLSYLCDDEMRSPEGSVSTDSSTVSKTWPPIVKSTSTVPQTLVRVKREKNETTIRHGVERQTTSTITSSANTPEVSSRRSVRTRVSVNDQVGKTSYSKVKRERQSKRRYVEIDSDDDTFVSHYRESREKNNEASRKSRMNKKAKENEMAMRATELERDNRILKMKVEELEKLVTSMRSALLRSALKKEL